MYGYDFFTYKLHICFGYARGHPQGGKNKNTNTIIIWESVHSLKSPLGFFVKFTVKIEYHGQRYKMVYSSVDDVPRRYTKWNYNVYIRTDLKHVKFMYTFKYCYNKVNRVP